MTNIIFEPTKIGVIPDEMFGDTDIYLASLPNDVEDIYQWRVQEELANDDGTDEFAFIGPSSKFGIKANNANTFVAAPANKEPMVLFKAHYHHVGHFYELVTPTEMGVNGQFVENSYGFYDLPKIPAEMVAKIDKFLHTVDKKYGTEGILLLTFDMDYKGAENEELGWNFAIPTQENTAQHCHYDKTNVVQDLMGTSTLIVGTIHSHPGMSAFASETDKKDQSGFDGLHITFGWKGFGDKLVREYHADLVRGDRFYNIKPEKVMDLDQAFQYEVEIDGEKVLVDLDAVTQVEAQFDITEEEIEELLEGVSKKAYTNNGTTQNSGTGGTKDPKAQPPYRGQQDISDVGDFIPTTFPRGVIEFPTSDFPDPTQNNIFLRIKSGTTDCIACNVPFNFTNIESFDRRQCLSCGIYLLLDKETPDDIDNVRIAAGYAPLKQALTAVPDIIWNHNPKSKDTWEIYKTFGESKAKKA